MLTRSYLGSVLIFLGGGFLIDQFGLWDFSSFIALWWPLLIIMFALLQMATHNVSLLGGGVVLLVGVLLQLSRIPAIEMQFHLVFWPALLVFVGVWLIFSRSSLSTFSSLRKNTSENSFDRFVLFGGLDDHITATEFKSGTITAIFGGGDLDMREAVIDPEGARLEINCIFGGVELQVPHDWKVVINGIPLFGGWENKTSLPVAGDSAPVLRVQCFVAFGGVEIKN